MIWLAEAKQERAPIASVHFPNGNTELIHGFNSPDRLVVVTSAADQTVNVVQLLEPALNRPEDCLALGVIGAGVSEQDIDILCASLDALFVIPGEAIERVARSLALAITTPGEPAHPWCCDWNDMRSLVSGVSPGAGRTGSARAVGPSAAKEAVAKVLEEIGSFENSRVLSLLTGPLGLRGAQIKEVSAAIRTQLGEGDYIAGVLQDSSMPEETVQVDIFVFGPAVPRSEPATAPAAFHPAVEIREIPAFLRDLNKP